MWKSEPWEVQGSFLEEVGLESSKMLLGWKGKKTGPASMKGTDQQGLTLTHLSKLRCPLSSPPQLRPLGWGVGRSEYPVSSRCPADARRPGD